MKSLCLIAGIYFALHPLAYALDANLEGQPVNSAITDFNEVAGHATDALTSCNDGHLPPKKVSFKKGDDASELYKEVDLNLPKDLPMGEYEGDQLTILTKDQADKLFKAFSLVDYMKFDYIHAGCEVRAHEFTLMAKANGIEMGKAMTMYGESISEGGLYPKEWKGKNSDEIPVPEGFVGWRYHVAPYLLVKDGNEVRPYVFDIGVAEKRKTLGQWNTSLTDAATKETRTFVKDREYLHPDDLHPRKEGVSYIQTELNKQELIREMGFFEFDYWDQKGLLNY